MEADDRVGLVEEYLNQCLPETWGKMDLYERRNWLSDSHDPTRAAGTVPRSTVSHVEIWSECFGRNPTDMKSADSYAIAALMTQIPGWERTKKPQYIPVYGRQRVYVRSD